MSYFCRCFICGSENVCAHREEELVVWWMSGYGKTAFVAAVVGRKPFGDHSEDVSPTKSAVDAPQVVARKPFVRAEALKRSGYNVVVSREDALALKRV